MATNLSDCAPQRAASGPALQELLALGQEHLQQADRGDSARLEAELLLAHALQRPRSYLVTHPGERPAPETAARYQALLARAAAGEPLAYLTGTREFWSLTLQVCPDVLIPRPETELAVERCLALLPAPAAPSAATSAAMSDVAFAGAHAAAGTRRARVCDLGTGSGAIALALASERPGWRITATDISPAALAVARANARRLALPQLEFIAGDWFTPLAGRSFELIVSNPPYVGAHDPALDALGHEPRFALTPGDSGLEALRHLILAARGHLSTGGWLVLEHGADQGPAVAAALVEAGYARVGCHRDLAGRDRISEGQRP